MCPGQGVENGKSMSPWAPVVYPRQGWVLRLNRTRNEHKLREPIRAPCKEPW